MNVRHFPVKGSLFENMTSFFTKAELSFLKFVELRNINDFRSTCGLRANNGF